MQILDPDTLNSNDLLKLVGRKISVRHATDADTLTHGKVIDTGMDNSNTHECWVKLIEFGTENVMAIYKNKMFAIVVIGEPL